MAGGGAPRILGRGIGNGRCPGGQPATTPTSLPRRRFHPIGAPGGGVPCCAFHWKASSGGCRGFPGRLRRKFGRVPPLPDSAPCHKPGTAREYPEKADGGIQMRHSQPHAPGPSPAGGRWRLVKKAAANAPCRDAGDMAGAIRAMMMSGEIAMAKLSRYLTL